MNFPRLPPRPVKPGLVPELGTRVEAKNDSRFCHFFYGRGFKPGLEQNEKMLFFFLFSFISSQGKNQITKPHYH